jgi:hypothetical protein
MTYPQAIVIAAAILGGAVIMSQRGESQYRESSPGIAIMPFGGPAGSLWMARSDGSARSCHPGSGEAPRCTPWTAP